MALENSKARFLELDSLRGIAALMVLLSHYTWAYDYHFDTLEAHKFHFFYGGFGLQIFFIISGYVIFMSIEKAKQTKDFTISRISRLYPTYWFCILITLTVTTIFPIPTLGNYSLSTILLNLTMIQGYLRTRHIDQVYWSLGVELMFYIFIGVLHYFKELKKIELYAIAWLLLSTLSSLINFPLENYLSIIFILRQAPLFIAGMMLYKIRNNQSNLTHHLILLSSLLSYYIHIHHDQLTSNMTPYIIITGIYALFYILAYHDLKVLKHPVFVFFGTISYPLYLLHNVIGYSVIYRVKMYSENQFVYTTIASIITISLAFLVSTFIEKPVSKKVKIKMHHYYELLIAPRK